MISNLSAATPKEVETPQDFLIVRFGEPKILLGALWEDRSSPYIQVGYKILRIKKVLVN